MVIFRIKGVIWNCQAQAEVCTPVTRCSFLIYGALPQQRQCARGGRMCVWPGWVRRHVAARTQRWEGPSGLADHQGRPIREGHWRTGGKIHFYLLVMWALKCLQAKKILNFPILSIGYLTYFLSHLYYLQIRLAFIYNIHKNCRGLIK